MPFSDVYEHKSHYVMLTALLTVHGIGLYWFRGVFEMQQLIWLSACIWYAIWGIGHHALTHHLTKIIVLEYVMLSLLAFVIGRALLGY